MYLLADKKNFINLHTSKAKTIFDCSEASQNRPNQSKKKLK